MEFSIKSASPDKFRSGCAVVGVFEPRKLSTHAQAIDTASKGGRRFLAGQVWDNQPRYP